ncbi:MULTISPECIES: winged helix-turn-helix transcriptional regulator [Pseudoalteromonas]|uniref:Helix-turn-helix domain-containing protein n=1 Tax=Pseudoalteromonas obscura TaxID=3048491 RepID=A0ABT7EMF2_9GAMM|nr:MULTISPECIES: helix-turn-helix domain-containing protein [Pseudoalteromonas]MBQ4837813.1 helix-turn-helix transcriptional regulator [Pseudoalteromonas luteoviolacea]MDK2596242.1 helix-turn-helix domain-containing protein [Pseudoalteromonas sp. P94(2023)]
MTKRSDCPISNVLDHVGDKWSLLIIRDLMFFGKHSYSELQNSDEKMATNILSSRLEKLEKEGLIYKQKDKQDKRKKVYRLTEAGIDMLPIMLEMIVWSAKHAPETNIPNQLVSRVHTDRAGLIQELTEQLHQQP